MEKTHFLIMTRDEVVNLVSDLEDIEHFDVKEGFSPLEVEASKEFLSNAKYGSLNIYHADPLNIHLPFSQLSASITAKTLLKLVAELKGAITSMTDIDETVQCVEHACQTFVPGLFLNIREEIGQIGLECYFQRLIPHTKAFLQVPSP